MRRVAAEYLEEEVIIDGVPAIRRRQRQTVRKAREPYLHISMGCVTALAAAGIPATAWPLALWVIWHHMVSSGGAASISTSFAARASIDSRAARRHAVGALEASGLFQISRTGTAAVQIALGPALKTLLAPGKSAVTFTQER